MVSDSDLYFAQCKMSVWGKFTAKRFQISKRYIKSVLATSYGSPFFCQQHFVYLKSKLKKFFQVSYKIFKFIISSFLPKMIFEKNFKARSEENLRLTKKSKRVLRIFLTSTLSTEWINVVRCLTLSSACYSTKIKIYDLQKS